MPTPQVKKVESCIAMQVMLPISSAPLPVCSVNQRLPSGTAVMPKGEPPEVGMEYSAILPLDVMRSIWFAEAESSVNQRLPSGPFVIPSGPLLGAPCSPHSPRTNREQGRVERRSRSRESRRPSLPKHSPYAAANVCITDCG